MWKLSLEMVTYFDFSEKYLLSQHQSGSFRDLHRPSLSQSSTKWNLITPLETLLGFKRCQFRLHTLHYWSSSYGHLNRWQEVSTVSAFHITIISSSLLPNSSFLCPCSVSSSLHSLTQLWSFSLSSSYLPLVHQQNLFDFPFSEWSINIPLIPLLYLPSLDLWTIAWLPFKEQPIFTCK